jgi:hypothetical protein
VIVGSALEAPTIVAGFDDVGENGYGGAAFHTHGSPQRLDVDSFFTGTSLLSMELPPNLRPARKGSTRTQFEAQSDIERRNDDGASVDYAWTIHADEADVITVSPMHASHPGKAMPVRAVVGGHLAVTAFDGGRVGNNAARIVADDPSAGASARSQQDAQHNDDQRIATHRNKPSTHASMEGELRGSTP